MFKTYIFAEEYWLLYIRDNQFRASCSTIIKLCSHFFTIAYWVINHTVINNDCPRNSVMYMRRRQGTCR